MNIGTVNGALMLGTQAKLVVRERITHVPVACELCWQDSGSGKIKLREGIIYLHVLKAAVSFPSSGIWWWWGGGSPIKVSKKG
jgi:hypothetical protein